MRKNEAQNKQLRLQLEIAKKESVESEEQKRKLISIETAGGKMNVTEELAEHYKQAKKKKEEERVFKLLEIKPISPPTELISARASFITLEDHQDFLSTPESQKEKIFQKDFI